MGDLRAWLAWHDQMCKLAETCRAWAYYAKNGSKIWYKLFLADTRCQTKARADLQSSAKRMLRLKIHWWFKSLTLWGSLYKLWIVFHSFTLVLKIQNPRSNSSDAVRVQRNLENITQIKLNILMENNKPYKQTDIFQHDSFENHSHLCKWQALYYTVLQDAAHHHIPCALSGLWPGEWCGRRLLS